MSFPPRPELPNPELVFNFFWRYTTLECAMKHAGLCKARENSDAIEANWDAFTKELEGYGAGRSQQFIAASRRLQRLRPQRQIITKNNKPGWEPITDRGPSELAYTIRLLQIVRNNLFHGGKYEYGGTPASIARDTDILEAALDALEQCFLHHPKVQERVIEVARAA